eukprot:TRINITY_DN1928_c0_g1_i2.p2 TRINITY_DN1928_c0_g1~~TRINITY_DN1928_c0_g1_i2.p2  ORF type:complete len:118 (-),score=51.86 TRINITY_DN1928_c0_g1_i2:149-502(-)
MIRRPPRSTQSRSSAASDVYKRQVSTQSTWGITRQKITDQKFPLSISYKMGTACGKTQKKQQTQKSVIYQIPVCESSLTLQHIDEDEIMYTYAQKKHIQLDVDEIQTSTKEKVKDLS